MSKIQNDAATTEGRLPARQFATLLSEDEIVEVAGGHPGPGTCTLNNDDDVNSG